MDVRTLEREARERSPEDLDYAGLLGRDEPFAPPALGSSSARGRPTLDQRLEGLREHLLPGGALGGLLLSREDAQVAAIVAADGTEGSSVRVAAAEVRPVARVVPKAALLRPRRQFVSYLGGGDVKLVVDPQLNKQHSARMWRVNGLVAGDEPRGSTVAEDPRPQRSMLDKLQLARASEASRKRLLLVAFVADGHSQEMPPPVVRLVGRFSFFLIFSTASGARRPWAARGGRRIRSARRL